jgi:hypothetical protein
MASRAIRPAATLPSKAATRARPAAIELRAVAPFDFDLALRYLRIWPAAVLERVEDGRYRRAVNVGGHDVLLSLHSIGMPARPRLVLEVFGAGIDRSVVERAAALIRRFF